MPSATSSKFIVSIINPGAAPADNGRTIHALKLAQELSEGGAQVRLLFQGEGVRWIQRFVDRDDDSHPFVKNYGPAFDAVRHLARACNMCCKRFDSLEAAKRAEVPVDGVEREHAELGSLLLDGWQLIHH
jgi:sulfur relay (sulfurtransferase) complex TusBCD TusD component (DsrE family)